MGREQLIPEDQIRARSYAIWVTEGRQEGHSDEYWFRALAELEAEWQRAFLVALEEHENMELVMPRLPISTPPHRCEADRIDPDDLKRAA